MKNRRLAGVLVIVAALGAFSYAYWAQNLGHSASGTDSPLSERTDGYFTVQDEASRTLFTTGHWLSVGDEYIDENDNRYVIERIEGDLATASSAGKMEALPMPPILAEAPKTDTAVVGIYHTHSDESYEPTDGTDSKTGGGGIISVGNAMADELQKDGIKVVHDTTLHDPHDAAAYDRSRRTAVQVLKQKPLALFDVHRDAGPAEPYLKDVDNTEVAKCMIVIGRTNPKMEANLDFARRLRDAANAKTSGIIKGIFLGKADFNQDLYDRALLLELGTEKTSREAAEMGIQLVASAVPNLLGLTGGGGGSTGSSKGTGRAIGWVLGLTVGAAFIYLWIATGSWEEMKAKILGWFGTGGVRIGGERRGNQDGSEEN